MSDKDYYRLLVSKGICPRCRVNNRTKTTATCEQCREKCRLMAKKYYQPRRKNDTRSTEHS